MVELRRLEAVAVEERAGVAVGVEVRLAQLLLPHAPVPADALVGADKELAVGDDVVGRVLVDEHGVGPQLDGAEGPGPGVRAEAEERRRRRGPGGRKVADARRAEVEHDVAGEVAVNRKGEVERAARSPDALRAVAAGGHARVLGCDGDERPVAAANVEDVRFFYRGERGRGAVALGPGGREALAKDVRRGEERIEALVAKDEFEYGALRHFFGVLYNRYTSETLYTMLCKAIAWVLLILAVLLAACALIYLGVGPSRAALGPGPPRAVAGGGVDSPGRAKYGGAPRNEKFAYEWGDLGWDEGYDLPSYFDDTKKLNILDLLDTLFRQDVADGMWDDADRQKIMADAMHDIIAAWSGDMLGRNPSTGIQYALHDPIEWTSKQAHLRYSRYTILYIRMTDCVLLNLSKANARSWAAADTKQAADEQLATDAKQRAEARLKAATAAVKQAAAAAAARNKISMVDMMDEDEDAMRTDGTYIVARPPAPAPATAPPAVPLPVVTAPVTTRASPYLPGMNWADYADEDDQAVRKNRTKVVAGGFDGKFILGLATYSRRIVTANTADRYKTAAVWSKNTATTKCLTQMLYILEQSLSNSPAPYGLQTARGWSKTVYDFQQSYVSSIRNNDYANYARASLRPPMTALLQHIQDPIYASYVRSYVDIVCDVCDLSGRRRGGFMFVPQLDHLMSITLANLGTVDVMLTDASTFEQYENQSIWSTHINTAINAAAELKDIFVKCSQGATLAYVRHTDAEAIFMTAENYTLYANRELAKSFIAKIDHIVEIYDARLNPPGFSNKKVDSFVSKAFIPMLAVFAPESQHHNTACYDAIKCLNDSLQTIASEYSKLRRERGINWYVDDPSMRALYEWHRFYRRFDEIGRLVDDRRWLVLSILYTLYAHFYGLTESTLMHIITGIIELITDCLQSVVNSSAVDPFARPLSVDFIEIHNKFPKVKLIGSNARGGIEWPPLELRLLDALTDISSHVLIHKLLDALVPAFGDLFDRIQHNPDVHITDIFNAGADIISMIVGINCTPPGVGRVGLHQSSSFITKLDNNRFPLENTTRYRIIAHRIKVIHKIAKSVSARPSAYNLQQMHDTVSKIIDDKLLQELSEHITITYDALDRIPVIVSQFGSITRPPLPYDSVGKCIDYSDTLKQDDTYYADVWNRLMDIIDAYNKPAVVDPNDGNIKTMLAIIGEHKKQTEAVESEECGADWASTVCGDVSFLVPTTTDAFARNNIVLPAIRHIGTHDSGRIDFMMCSVASDLAAANIYNDNITPNPRRNSFHIDKRVKLDHLEYALETVDAMYSYMVSVFDALGHDIIYFPTLARLEFDIVHTFMIPQHFDNFISALDELRHTIFDVVNSASMTMPKFLVTLGSALSKVSRASPPSRAIIGLVSRVNTSYASTYELYESVRSKYIKNENSIKIRQLFNFRTEKSSLHGGYAKILRLVKNSNEINQFIIDAWETTANKAQTKPQFDVAQLVALLELMVEESQVFPLSPGLKNIEMATIAELIAEAFPGMAEGERMARYMPSFTGRASQIAGTGTIEPAGCVRELRPHDLLNSKISHDSRKGTTVIISPSTMSRPDSSGELHEWERSGDKTHIERVGDRSDGRESELAGSPATGPSRSKPDDAWLDGQRDLIVGVASIDAAFVAATARRIISQNRNVELVFATCEDISDFIVGIRSAMAHHPTTGPPFGVCVLVVSEPGDLRMLYAAASLALGGDNAIDSSGAARDSASGKARGTARHTTPATGWLYRIKRTAFSDDVYHEIVTFVDPARYAI